MLDLREVWLLERVSLEVLVLRGGSMSGVERGSGGEPSCVQSPARASLSTEEERFTEDQLWRAHLLGCYGQRMGLDRLTQAVRTEWSFNAAVETKEERLVRELREERLALRMTRKKSAEHERNWRLWRRLARKETA